MDIERATKTTIPSVAIIADGNEEGAGEATTGVREGDRVERHHHARLPLRFGPDPAFVPIPGARRQRSVAASANAVARMLRQR